MILRPLRVLLALVLLLLGGLLYLWVDAQGQLRIPAWAEPSGLAPGLGDPVAPHQLSALTAPNAESNLSLLERPIFAPDRRPPPPPLPAVPAPPPDPLNGTQIVGTFSGESAGVVALVDGKLRRIKVGQAVGLWLLDGVDAHEASFRQQDQIKKLTLVRANLGVASSGGIKPVGPTVPAARLTGGLPGSPSKEDEARERLRRRNEIRAARGLPIITD